MQRILPDLRDSGVILLVVSLALSVAVFMGMLSVGEPARQEALAMIPPPDVDSYTVVRARGREVRRSPGGRISEEETGLWEISNAQLAAIERVRGILAVCRFTVASPTAKYGRRHANFPMMAVDQPQGLSSELARTLEMGPPGRTYGLWKGREISQAETQEAARVCVVGSYSAQQLGLVDVGETVRLDGYPFEVVGIGVDDRDISNIPVTTYASLFGKEVALRIAIEGEALALQARLEPALQDIFQTPDHFLLRSGVRDSALRSKEAAARRLLSFGLIGAIPVGVAFFGAFGIAVVWARDRAWSFALLRALGASRAQVALGVAVEPISIACFAGILGLGVGWLLTAGLHALTGLEVGYYWGWMAAAWGAGLLAIVPSAVYVALRAAYVQPTEALRV